MVMHDLKKLTRLINTIILVMVFCLMGFFAISKATFMVWFSIPTALVYILGFFLIQNDRLDVYLRMVYGWLTLYMSLATVCLGYEFGFHLYCMSMIPIIFYTEYMAYKLGRKRVPAIVYSGLVIICYLLSTGYSSYFSPIYSVDGKISMLFWLVNSVIVLGFVTFYSYIMIDMTIKSDKLLTERANKDYLTKLYNRNYTMDKIKDAFADGQLYYIAMIDIDNFKRINDTYGHSAGDVVLKKVASVMETVCSDSTVARWGGEEFLILSLTGSELIEKLRDEIENTPVEFEDQKIKVTVTAGVSSREGFGSVDKWIIAADEKLYYGKNNGKNRVVT
ncbi:diguanylate cyclase (GGDEF) domain-containing protein [Ruminococcaceae bacterium YAD3003]|nr:diguanylate cyclase (GGDEF) domain-containing protein [Ruminococcaceae bacterium YAD3003]